MQFILQIFERCSDWQVHRRGTSRCATKQDWSFLGWLEHDEMVLCHGWHSAVVAWSTTFRAWTTRVNAGTNWVPHSAAISSPCTEYKRWLGTLLTSTWSKCNKYQNIFMMWKMKDLDRIISLQVRFSSQLPTISISYKTLCTSWRNHIIGCIVDERLLDVQQRGWIDGCWTPGNSTTTTAWLDVDTHAFPHWEGQNNAKVARDTISL